ncbi:hypothetical protein K469DRAFT_701232 [Zopfia rhizophila CBS 207.26]|uniref:Uncharacterized protein n=1 Tax=Zopfia rhizophila CBS 207.26 TaxID=1314779 RepID=A0A6A6ED63_9PEZI|nr:hypothetical protein K469DRAFT_701232 [Zopfia rhizophila CBS 207.26]
MLSTSTNYLVDKVTRRFKGLEGKFINMAAQEPWDDIVPVECKKQASDDTLSDWVPSNHPDKIVKLWRLQSPRHRNTLISLLEFYDISGWKSWGFEDRLVSDSDSELDDIGKEDVTLPAAVANYPRIALRALTIRLGVNFERMEKRMLEWEDDQKCKMKEVAIQKRKQEVINRGLGRRTADDRTTTAPGKLRKIDSRSTSYEQPTRLPHRDLVGHSKSDEPRLSPESGTKLLWNAGSSGGETQRVSRDTPGCKAASEGSTVPFTEETG